MMKFSTRMNWPAALFFLCIGGLLLWPVSGEGAEISLQSQTLFRFMQRDTVTTSDATVLPFYEYLQIDAGERKSRGLAFHAFGWGRYDAADNDYFDDNPTGELIYGYFEYRRSFSNFNLRFGRHYVIGGLANDSLDGVSVGVDLGNGLRLNAYGGLPVAYDTTAGRGGDSLFGGRVVWTPSSIGNFGLSYRRLANDGDTQDQRLGFDLLLLLPAGIDLSGRLSYNLETDDLGESFAEVRVDLAGVALRPYVEHYVYADAFAPGNRIPNPFYTLNRGKEAQTAFGVDATWWAASDWEFGVKTRYTTFDVKDDDAQFASALLTWHEEALTQVGGELGTMQGDGAGNNYLLGRLFFYWDRPGGLPLGFVSGDVLYARYDDPIFGEDGSLFASLGCGRRFLDDRLELKLSGDFSSDPYFDSDWRGMLVATYGIGR